VTRAVSIEPARPPEDLTAERFERTRSAAFDSFTRSPADARPTASALVASFHEQLAGALYAGDIRPGDRLPSIREFAFRAGVNRKTAERVYRTLEAEGVVDLRPRSGVYLAHPAPTETSSFDGPPEWIDRLIADAANQPGGLAALPRTIHRFIGGREISCACVDSTEDLRVGLTGELRRRFGLRVYPLRGGPLTDPAEETRLAHDLADVDIVVTTPYHPALARLARALNKPVAVVVPDPSFVAAMRSCVERSTTDLLCVDREFGERLTHLLPVSLRARLRISTVGDAGALPTDGHHFPRLVTEAAHIALAGDRMPTFHLHPRYLGAESNGMIGRLIARLNATARGG